MSSQESQQPRRSDLAQRERLLAANWQRTRVQANLQLAEGLLELVQPPVCLPTENLVRRLGFVRPAKLFRVRTAGMHGVPRLTRRGVGLRPPLTSGCGAEAAD